MHSYIHRVLTEHLPHVGADDGTGNKTDDVPVLGGFQLVVVEVLINCQILDVLTG